MKIIKHIYNHKTLDLKIISKINNFININSEDQNSLFISPVFASDYSKRYNIEFEYIVFYTEEKICALKLVFYEFKFYQRLVNQKTISFLAKPLLKFFFPKRKWFIPILFDKNISKSYRDEINLIYQNFINQKNIYRSPINRDLHVDNSLIWGTYILDLSFKKYEDIFKNYKNSLRKSIKAFSLNAEFTVHKINIHNKKDLNRYIYWVKNIQKRYRKSTVYEFRSIIEFKKKLNSQNFIYEIFVLQNSLEEIFSSLTIYGDCKYVNEYDANYSLNIKYINFSTHDILRNEAIKFCLDRNIKFFDFSGFNPNAKKGSKEFNIKFSKSKFNGNPKYIKLINS